MDRTNHVDMVVRNVRPAYSISSEHLTDQFDEIYKNIVELLGYQDIGGEFPHRGRIYEQIEVLTTELEGIFGIAASGYYESTVVSPGDMDDSDISAILLEAKLNSMINNPW